MWTRPKKSQKYWVFFQQYWFRTSEKPSQHSMLGHHRPASETPFKLSFTGGQMMTHFQWYMDPLSLIIWREKTLSEVDPPPCQNFLDPCMFIYSHTLYSPEPLLYTDVISTEISKVMTVVTHNIVLISLLSIEKICYSHFYSLYIHTPGVSGLVQHNLKPRKSSF